MIAVNEGTLPAPLAAKPIEGFEFVQLNVAPAGVLVKLVPDGVLPLQVVGLKTAFTVGSGFTVIVTISVTVVGKASVTVMV